MSRSAAIDRSGVQGAPAVAELRQVLRLVAEIAGDPEPDGDEPLDDAARLTTAYEDAPDICRRRFNALARDAAAFAAAGVAALLAQASGGPARAAAATCLADEIRGALRAMARLLVLPPRV